MSFLKCISCGNSSVKVFGCFPGGTIKSKCQDCGLMSANDSPKKNKIKEPEVIYSR
jgi:hypothetical protein